MIPLLLLACIAGLMQAARSFSTELGPAATQLAFGFLLLTAFLAGKLVDRLRLPRLTGYIIAGVIAGPQVLALVTAPMTSSLQVVNSTAVAIIALEAGAELDLRAIRPLRRTLVAICGFAVIGAMIVIAVALVGLSAYVPVFDGMSLLEVAAVAAVLGVALAAQSPAVVMAMLAELRAQGPLSATMLASVVVADLVVIVCFSIASAIASTILGGGVDPLTRIGNVSWELFGSIGFGVAIGMLLGLFQRSVNHGMSLFALLVSVVVGELGARVHLDPLIVMLAAGVWLRNFARADAHALLAGWQSAQLPVFLVFFALAGARLDLAGLWSVAIPVAVIVVVRGIAFFLGATAAGRITGAPAMVTRHAWLGLVPQAGLALALALVIAEHFPTFGPAASTLVLSVVGVNQLIGPILLRFALLSSGEVGRKEQQDFGV
jgi:Kef-type K+ transport system membrane component KefB